MKKTLLKGIIYRVVFLFLTILIIPLLPIIIIFTGISSPEYVIKGTLNINLSQSEIISYWDIYTSFLKNIIQLDFGISTSTGKPVIIIVVSRLLESMKLIIPSIITSYLIGTFWGFWSENSKKVERFWNRSQFVFYIPMIVISYLLLYLLSFLNIDFLSNTKYFAGIVVLSIYPIFVITNSIKKTLRELHDSDFFLFHKSIGFNKNEIWRKFCYKFLIIDYLSFFENILIFMIGFIYFVEMPFGINGMGYEFVIAIQRFDYPVIIGFCIFSVILLNLVGIIIEPIKTTLDPRGTSV